MRVKCVSDKDSFLREYTNITVGEIYNVTALGKDYSMGTDVYTITDDNGLYFTHGISIFRLIEEDQEETPESISEESNIEDKSLKEILEQEILSLKLQLQKREDMLKCMEIMDNWGVEIQFLEPMPF